MRKIFSTILLTSSMAFSTSCLSSSDDDENELDDETTVEEDDEEEDEECIHSDFLVVNTTDHYIKAYVGWRDADGEKTKSIVTIGPDGEYIPDDEACYDLYAYSYSRNEDEKWSELSDCDRSDWCKKLKCADYESVDCWDELYPMKYNGSVCVCDID
jgi:hypothetical protein